MSQRKIPLAGVIGTPIAHSKSPRLHTHWLRSYGVAGHYIPMDVSQEDLRQALSILPRLGFVGVNVTIPHKEAVIEIADLVTDRAALIGAANTLIFRKDGKIHADNTDGVGFFENIKANAPKWHAQSGPVGILGAGGASRAVIASLLEVGVPEIRLSNRTRSRAEALRQEFGTKITVVDWVKAGNMMDGLSLLVNTTSLGMEGSAELRVPLDGLRRETVVNDLVYAPLETKLLQEAAQIGCTTVDG